jgi:hypothetical protein
MLKKKRMGKNTITLAFYDLFTSRSFSLFPFFHTIDPLKPVTEYEVEDIIVFRRPNATTYQRL